MSVSLVWYVPGDSWLHRQDPRPRLILLVQGLVRLGMPTSWGLVLAMALRYPGTLQALYFTVRDAQRSRGLRLEGRGLLGRVRPQLPVLIAMLVAALRSIEGLAMALEAR